jgi:3-oxo-5alpha-steroid 4-dehydrogenase
VIGVEYTSIPRLSPVAILHRIMVYVDYKSRYAQIGFRPLADVSKAIFSLMEKTGRKKRVRACQGVILASGGFIFNKKMVEKYAPKYVSGALLGNVADDGSGIEMGISLGGDTGQMNRVSVWRFITPPEAMVKGVLVDLQGQRICNEQLYGAQMSEYMVEEHGGKAKLIMDQDIRKLIRKEVGWGKIWWFQNMTVFINYHFNRKKANSIEKLAKKCGIPEDSLRDTIKSYNDIARNGRADPMGKDPEHLQPIAKPPFYAIDCSLKNMLFPCATLTLGGLVVEEETGQVKRKDSSIIDGLYAVGRTAVGVPSRGYVSGLAIAHCVWSGRHAAAHVAARGRS